MQTRVAAALVFFFLSLPSIGLASDFCARGQWPLTGAKAQADDLGAAYVPEWDGELKKLAACLERESARRNCLIVQGHYDATPIPGAIARVFASQELAQQARARGRSTAVIRRLIELGIASDRLREAVPGKTPTYRGASLTLDPACRADMTDEERAAKEKARIELEATKKARVEMEATQKALEAERERLAREREEAERARALAGSEGAGSPGSLSFFGQVGLQGALGLAAEEGPTTWPFGLRAAVGLTRDWFTLFGGGAINLAHRSAQGKGLELFASAGAKPLSWLTVGPTIGVRRAGSDFFSSWLERSWYLGLFATEELRLSERGSLAFEQAIHPFGQEQYRGTVVDGKDVWVPSYGLDSSRFELGIAYRHSF